MLAPHAYRLQEVDEGDEAVALDTVAVEVVGLSA